MLIKLFTIDNVPLANRKRYILAGLTAAFRFVNYAFFMLFLIMLIVLILDLDVPKDWQLAETRVFHTVLGGALAVISYYLWPIWQKRSREHLTFAMSINT